MVSSGAGAGPLKYRGVWLLVLGEAFTTIYNLVLGTVLGNLALPFSCAEHFLGLPDLDELSQNINCELVTRILSREMETSVSIGHSSF